MKSWLLAALVGVLVFAGCGMRDRTEGLQQEKLLLDLIKTQSDQLAQLMQKENDLRGLAKKNEESLQEVERQRAAFQTLQQETARRIALPRTQSPRRKRICKPRETGSKWRRNGCGPTSCRTRRVNGRLRYKRRNSAACGRACRPEPRVEIRGTDVRRQAQEQRSHAEIAARVKKRQPYLDELATLTANFFASGMVRTTVRSEVLDLLVQSKVAETKEDGAFVDGALGIAESFYLNRTRYPYMTHEKKAFDQWRQTYLKAAAGPGDKMQPGLSHERTDSAGNTATQRFRSAAFPFP